MSYNIETEEEEKNETILESALGNKGEISSQNDEICNKHNETEEKKPTPEVKTFENPLKVVIEADEQLNPNIKKFIDIGPRFIAVSNLSAPFFNVISTQDNREDQANTSYKKFFFILLSIILCIADVFSDLYLSLQYYLISQYLYASLTLLFCIIPTIFIGFFYNPWLRGKLATFLWLTGLYPVVGSLSRLKIWFRYRKYEELYGKVLTHQESSMSYFHSIFLAFAEKFLEATPQLILQVSILIITFYKTPNVPVDFKKWIGQIISIGTALFSTGTCLNYLQFFEIDPTLPFNGQPRSKMFSLWRTLLATSRILSFISLTCVNIYMTGMVFIVHATIVSMNLNPGNWERRPLLSRVYKFIMGFLIGLIMLFVYLPIIRTKSSFSTMLYIIFALENFLISCAFGIYFSDTRPWFYLPFISVIFSLTSVGFTLRYFYPQTTFNPVYYGPMF